MKWIKLSDELPPFNKEIVSLADALINELQKKGASNENN